MKLHSLIVVVWAAVLAFSGFTPQAEAAGLCQGIAVPAYFPPGPLWAAAIGAAPRTAVLIMNPDSGPGASKDMDYAVKVTAAQAAGIKVLGYVHTSYGARPALEVKSEINAYKAWYSVDGIFLDETSPDPLYLSYYRVLASYIRGGKGGFVMLNPGVVPAEGYVRLADTTVVFEDSYAVYKTWTPPAWLLNYPAAKLTHLVHDAIDIRQMTDAVNLSRSRNAGLLYITNDTFINKDADDPWDSLPSYWSTEVKTMTYACSR
jgi:hypothetical protein